MYIYILNFKKLDYVIFFVISLSHSSAPSSSNSFQYFSFKALSMGSKGFSIVIKMAGTCSWQPSSVKRTVQQPPTCDGYSLTHRNLYSNFCAHPDCGNFSSWMKTATFRRKLLSPSSGSEWLGQGLGTVIEVGWWMVLDCGEGGREKKIIPV